MFPYYLLAKTSFICLHQYYRYVKGKERTIACTDNHLSVDSLYIKIRLLFMLLNHNRNVFCIYSALTFSDHVLYIVK